LTSNLTRDVLLISLGLSVTGNNANASEVDWTGGVTAVIQHADSSRIESELTASADLFATLAMGSGEWLLYIEASTAPRSRGVSAFYPTVNGDAGSVLTRDGDGGVQVSEFNYTFRYSADQTLMLGLIDPSAWLDRGRIANDENQHFLNGSFINNATIEFPDYSLGSVYRVPSQGRRPEMTVVVSGSDGIADVPDRSYQDLLDFNAAGRGVFLGAGASWLFDHASWRLGAWIRSDDHAVAGSATDQDKNYGVYLVHGLQSGPHALNIRGGFANSNVSVASDFFAVAYQRDSRHGLFGVGVAHTGISRGFRTAARSRAFDSEVYYRIPIFDGSGHITPSIQYVEVPGFDASETVPGSTAVITSVRVHYNF
jgi:hypothetical protein